MSKSRRTSKKVAQIPGQSLKETHMNDEYRAEATDEDAFDPSEHTATEVIEELENADAEEAERIAAAEAEDKARKTVLSAAEDAGVDVGALSDQRRDASGRVLNGWEVSPKPAS